MRRLLLTLELARWRAAGQAAQLWWRDDDAREPSPALDRLLDLAARQAIPLTLAAVPDGDRAALGARLASAAGVILVQHGADHVDRSGGVGGKREFDPQTSRADVAAALAAGWERLAPLPGAFKAFVPPWNAIHPALEGALKAAGYRAWSAYDAPTAGGDPPRIDTHLDVLRWKGGGRFRGEGRILGRLTRLLAERRKTGRWPAPIGLLTHHLDHDEAAWAFLERFMTRTRTMPALAWRALPELIAGA